MDLFLKRTNLLCRVPLKETLLRFGGCITPIKWLLWKQMRTVIGLTRHLSYLRRTERALQHRGWSVSTRALQGPSARLEA